MIQRAIRLVAKDRQLLIIVGITVLAFVGLSVLRGETFLTPRNLTSMALQVSDLGVLALAMMIAMVIGGIDLSVTAAANLSAIVAARVVLPLGADGPLALLLIVSVAIAVGLLCGLINGTLIGLAGVPPILATLGTLTLFAGVATVLTNGVSIYGFPKSLTDVGTSSIAFIPVPLILVAVAAVGVWVLLNRTPFGLKMYLLGANPRATLFSGIRNGRVTLLSYVASGLLSAIAGVIVMARTDSANPNYGASYVLVTILVVVLGGVAVTGGSGRVSGVIVALVLLQILSTGLNMLLVGHGDSNFFRDLAWGAVLLTALALPRISLRRRALPRSAPINQKAVNPGEIG